MEQKIGLWEMGESETFHPHTNNTEHGLPWEELWEMESQKHPTHTLTTQNVDYLERIVLMVAFNELKVFIFTDV